MTRTSIIISIFDYFLSLMIYKQNVLSNTAFQFVKLILLRIYYCKRCQFLQIRVNLNQKFKSRVKQLFYYKNPIIFISQTYFLNQIAFSQKQQFQIFNYLTIHDFFFIFSTILYNQMMVWDDCREVLINGSYFNNFFSQQYHNMFKIKSTEPRMRAINTKISKIKQLVNIAMDEIKSLNRNYDSYHTLSPTKRKSDESSQSQSIAEVLIHMKKGYLFIKHSPNTSQPHTKFIYLSHDHKYLCWKSPEKNDQKKIEISMITHVVRSGCQFYMKACQGVRYIANCIFVGSVTRNLELEAANQIQAEIFKEQLNRVIRWMQGMSHNYNYTK